jgi:hypothetical protein
VASASLIAVPSEAPGIPPVLILINAVAMDWDREKMSNLSRRYLSVIGAG